MKEMINKRKYLFLFTCIFYIINTTSQEVKFDEDDLLGKWDAYKVTTLKGGDGSDITLDEKPFNKKLMMNFIDSKMVFFSLNDSEEHLIEYYIKDNKIIIAHRKYIIEVLTKTTLTLIEEKLFGNRIYLKKDDS